MADIGPPGGASTTAGGVCTHCPHGKIEVIVWKHAVCWDTPNEGEAASDPRFEGVTVKVNTAEPYELTTGGDGKVLFENLVPATYTITAKKPAYADVTDEIKAYRGSQVVLDRDVTVEVGQTSFCDLALRAKQARYNDNGTWDGGRECMRRHAKKPGTQAGGGTLKPILWSEEPSWLIMRDLFWLATGTAAVVAAIVGLILGAMAALSFAAIAAAFFGYLGGLIFGEGFGSVAIPVAAAMFAVLLVAAALMAIFGGSPDPYGLGILGGIWAAFSAGYLPGRRDVWQINADPVLGLPRLYIWASGLLAAAAAGLIAGGFLMASKQTPGMGSVIIAIVLGGFLGALSGWCGYAFANEGKTNMGFGATDFQLPYAGERYCVQGVRGLWTHFGDEEGAYDFSMPVGTDVLCGKEGHIVAHSDFTETFEDRTGANYMGVRHPDGSIARYAYFKTQPRQSSDGPALNPRDAYRGKVLDTGGYVSSGAGWRFDGMAVAPSTSANPVHVRPGNVLGATGEPYDAKEPDYSYVLKWGIAFSVFALALVFVPAFTVWKGEPPSTLLTNYKGSVFQGLFDTGDTNYAYATKLDAIAKGDTTTVNDLNKLQEKMSHCPVPEKFDNQFCECLQLGPIEQYGNTFSDLGFIALGLILLGSFASSGPDSIPYSNRMTSLVNYTMTYGFVCIFMGPGSMLLHVSMTASGGLGDGMSMYMFMGFWISYNVVRLFNKCRLFFYSLFFSIVIVATGLNIFMLTSAALAPKTRLIMYGLGGVAAIFQFGVFWFSDIKTEDFFHGYGYFLLSAAFFVGAFTIWALTFTGSPLCLAGGAAGTPFTPSSPIQGHAFWHILAAAGVFTMYFYFQHQKEPVLEPCPPGFPRLHFTVSEAPPAGPGIDADPPEVHPGDRLPEIKFKPVKFTDGSLARDEARPWSFRKYASDNQSLGLPALPDDEALLYPKGGEHAPPEPIEGPEPPGALQQAPSAPPATAAAAPSAPSPSMPSGMPQGMPPSGGMPSIPSGGGTPPSVPE